MGLNVLLTGGAGYIGSTTAAQLVERNHQVTIIDNLSRGHRQAIPENARLIVGDISDAALLEQVLSQGRFDAVMHFAALIEAGESMKVPERYFRNNTANALTLLEAVLKHNVARFVFSSTAALYGDPDVTPIEETAALHPTNAYGESKLYVERMLDWFHRIHGLRYASLRYFNAAGARLNHGENHEPESHLIPIVLDVALPRAGFLNVVAVDSEDRATVLYPNKYNPSNEVKAGPFRFPTPDMNFVLRAAEPLGPSLVVAFLTEKRVNLLELGIEGRDAAGQMQQTFTDVSARATRAISVEAREHQFAAGTLTVKVDAAAAN